MRLQLAACLANNRRPKAAAGHYLALAHQYAAKRLFNDALELGRQILVLDPARFSYANMSDIVVAVGPSAVPLCRRAVELHRQAGRDDLAADLLLLCCRLEPSNIELWRELSQVYVDHQMTAEGAWALRRAAHLLHEAGDYSQVIELAQTILELDPCDLETRRLRSQALLKTGKPARAISELSDLLRRKPDDEEDREALAHTLAVSGNSIASLSVLERLIDELLDAKRRSHAQALLERARAWRPADHDYGHRLDALLDRQPGVPVHVEDDPRPFTGNGTARLVRPSHTPADGSFGPEAEEVDEIFDATYLLEPADQEEPQRLLELHPAGSVPAVVTLAAS